MDELTKSPLFKKIDRAAFERIDKFKMSPGYNSLQDFYNGLEEEQQKFFKALVIFMLFFLPALFLGLFWWHNQSLKSQMELRLELISTANQILGQKQGLQNVSDRILSSNPIDGASMMTSRLSNLLSTIGVDLSKIQVSNYEGSKVSGSIMRSEADFKFNNLSTDDLMNIFSAMIQREKFKIESVDIRRNADTNLLQGQFHAVHFGNAQSIEEE